MLNAILKTPELPWLPAMRRGNRALVADFVRRVRAAGIAPQKVEWYKLARTVLGRETLKTQHMRAWVLSMSLGSCNSGYSARADVVVDVDDVLWRYDPGRNTAWMQTC